MKQFLFLALVGACFLSTASARVFICYWGRWSVYRNYMPSNLPVSECTHIIYSFAGVDQGTWKIRSLDADYDLNRNGFKDFIKQKTRNPNVKLLLAVGGGAEGVVKYSQLVSSKDRRQTFINSVVEWMNTYNFDGLDLDWEYPGATDMGGSTADKANFVALCREIRQAFDRMSRRRLLTMAVSIEDYRMSNGYDVAALGQVMDYINVMTYDLRGTWNGFADHQSPVDKRSFDDGILAGLNLRAGLKKWADRGAPKNKLVVGIPFYGRTYTLQNPSNNGMRAPTKGPGRAGDFSKEAGVLAHFELCHLIPKYQQGFDNVGKVPYMFSGDQWVGYENAASIKAKCDLVKSEGYAGAMVWSVDMDDHTNQCGQGANPLVKLIKANLN